MRRLVSWVGQGSDKNVVYCLHFGIQATSVWQFACAQWSFVFVDFHGHARFNIHWFGQSLYVPKILGRLCYAIVQRTLNYAEHVYDDLVYRSLVVSVILQDRNMPMTACLHSYSTPVL